MAGGGSAQFTQGCGCMPKYEEHTISNTVLPRGQPRPPVSHSEIAADLSEQNSMRFHSFITTKMKASVPIQGRAENNRKRPTWYLCSALQEQMTLPRACPGGSSCPETSNTRMLLPFCIWLFFKRLLSYSTCRRLIYPGSSLLLEAAQLMH